MKKPTVKNRDLEFIYEIGALRHIKRTWVHFGNPDFQNLAEHHLRVAWIALILAKMEKVKDTGKVLKLAILHDIAESRTGDADYLSRQYIKRDEELGIKDILSSTILEEEFLALFKEYEERKTPESKIVKDADVLDVDLELKEQEAKGSTLRKVWLKNRDNYALLQLSTKSAKKLWRKIQKSNPHDWHTKGRNRFNTGEWKK